MMLPTQDNQLKLRLFAILTHHEETAEAKRDTLITDILSELEKRGYHVGLPSSIEQALNSGDGVYRP